MNYVCHPLGDWTQSPKYDEREHGGNDDSPTRMDFPCDRGTPIYAIVSGKITETANGAREGDKSANGGQGNYIHLVSNKFGYSTLTGEELRVRYMHLTESIVSEGQEVSIGQLIGYSGNTGDSTGPHLHIDMSINRFKDSLLHRPGVELYDKTRKYYEENGISTQWSVPLKAYRGQSPDSGIVGDNYFFHLFRQPLKYVTSTVSVDGGIPLNPEKYGFQPPTNEYKTLSFSDAFMGPYPTSQSDIDKMNEKGGYDATNPYFPIILLTYSASKEYGVKDAMLSYGKLYRSWIMYRVNENYINEYRGEGKTLRGFSQAWEKLETLWNKERHDYSDLTDQAPSENIKKILTLDNIQNMYKNIKFPDIYGIKDERAIQGCNTFPFKNDTSGNSPNKINSVDVSWIELGGSGRYVMYNQAEHYNAVTSFGLNPAVLGPSSAIPAVQKDGAYYFDGLLVVNKTYELGAEYNVSGLNSGAESNFNKMRESWDAYAREHKIINEPMSIASGYRSNAVQASIYNGYVSRDGQAAADIYSARPGHSEHETGLAIDVTLANSAENNPGNSYVELFPNQSKWLAEHCGEFGFIIRYPKGKENFTGYRYEPWHIRYVGTDWVKKLNGKTIEEYFQISSKYQN